MSLYQCCVGVRQSVGGDGGDVRAEANERDSQSQQTQEKGHPWWIMEYIISYVGDRLPETHHQAPNTPEL